MENLSTEEAILVAIITKDLLKMWFPKSNQPRDEEDLNHWKTIAEREALVALKAILACGVTFNYPKSGEESS